MKKDQENFTAASIRMRLDKGINEFDEIVASIQSEACVDIANRMKADVESHDSEGILSLAMIGQYSAGKSTIVTALTHRTDIGIDSDIKTDSISEYLWNGIHIIDTPGQ